VKWLWDLYNSKKKDDIVKEESLIFSDPSRVNNSI